MAVFGNRAQRIWNLVASAVAVAIISWFVGYEGDYLHSLLAGSNSTELARVNSLLLILLYSTLLFSFVVVAGRLLFVKLEHIGSPKDRAIQLVTNEEYRFEIAKQNERLEIAKDLSQLLVQKLAAVVSVSEGGRYAIKSDPMSAERTLDRVYSAAKDAQSELRRLYDYLNSSIFSELASFRISDLQTLSVAYRELGYNTVIEENGQSFPLNDGVELCIYKIVFEALQNVRKHAPAGTDVDINFLWVENGLQVLVKDNGIEFSNRQRANVGQLVDGYSAEDDLESLTSEIDGATLAVLRDRAAIYNGRIEASLVPGVGFTLSAIFPNLKALSSKEPL
jgi:signal transduction histidine kinase